MEQESQFNPEREYGADVTIRNFWVRHAQKMSGEIVSAEKATLSTAAITPKGAEHAKAFGEQVEASPHGAKGYVSTSDRTRQTVEQILDGYQQKNPDAPVRSLRVREALTADYPPGFLELYDQKFGVEKRKILAERGLTADDFKRLSTDEQERIAEAAEEPVLREWLGEPEGALARLYPPQDAAARFALLFDRRHERLAGKLRNGSEVDLFHVTHKTMTEPFLTSGVLVRQSDGVAATSLETLGGSLETLGNWESSVTTDADGQPTTAVTVRGEQYTIDPEAYAALLERGRMLRDAKEEPTA